jgi:hypothetical protein
MSGEVEMSLTDNVSRSSSLKVESSKQEGCIRNWVQPSSCLHYMGLAPSQIKLVLLSSHLNLLMLCTPFAIASANLGWGDTPTFFLSLLAICPFAERLGMVTEALAYFTNDTLGGLLNATFGNVRQTF